MLTSCSLNFIAVLATLGMPSLVCAQIIEGPAEVIDGDSLKVAGSEIRLFGVDAPELTQSCYSNEVEIPCGAMAKDVLAGLIGGAVLTCQKRGTDPFGRIVATCQTSGLDVGDALVRSGWAFAFRRYGDDYVLAEMRARAAGAGVWQWDFRTPEDYRASRQAALQSPALEDTARSATRTPPQRRDGQCLIKGNHSRRGDWIYHLPGMPYYEATRAEAYFCTEAEAQAAGYRRAIVR